MTADQWRRISAVFAAARELPESQRIAYLDVACAGHPEDRGEVESLLAKYDEAESPQAGVQPDHVVLRPSPFAVGQQVGRYRVLRTLKPGYGGMGVLYVAEDNLRREVVLKLLAPDLAHDERLRQRLRQEAEVMARLQHPGIATVHAFEEVDGVPFLVSELVKGRDLRERLDADGPFDLRGLLALGLDVAEALTAAHAAGIIHRDLKPENIMLPDAGGVKLIDFGIARVVDDADMPTRAAVTGTGTLIGTPAYMTPEQLQGGRLDHRSDLFALGVVLYEAGTGAHPFAGRTRVTTFTNILQLQQPPLGSRRPMEFGALESIVARCLQKHPTQRYGSAAELATACRGALEAMPRATGVAVTSERADVPPSDALWWWKFHQAAVSVFYGLLLIPLWLLRDQYVRGPTSDALFFGALAAAVVSILVRLHGAFLARHATETLEAVLGRWRRTVLVTDLGFGTLLLAAASLAATTKPGLSALMLVGALATLVTLLVIEPATTRAAFDREAR